ncbi:FecCD family ABC transporter permease [Methanocaldococcus infernus]
MVINYKEYIKRKILTICFVTAILIIFIIVSLSVGDYTLKFDEVIRAIFFMDTNKYVNVVVWNLRMPRVIGAIIAGAALSVSGLVMQRLLKNPLASPFTLGVSHGAMFGAALAIILFGFGEIKKAGIIINNPYFITLFAFLGAFLAIIIILILSKIKNLSPEAVILSGVAISSLFTAGTILLQYFADELQLAAIVYWSFGDLGRVVWNEIFLMFLVTISIIVYFYYKRWNYLSLTLGEDVAKSLGVDVERERLIGLFLSSLLVAVTVSFLGIIGFIGLISPHISRILIGDDDRFLIPLTSTLGALILLVSDTLARTIMAPIILPVGILTSFLGAPMFLYLLLKMK